MSIAWRNPGSAWAWWCASSTPHPSSACWCSSRRSSPRRSASASRWLLLVSVIYGTNIFFNLIFGVISDRLGWRNTIFWFGALGCSATILLLYFVPVAAGADYYWLALLVGAAYGATLAGFVPISALLPSLAPENKGGAMALLNFGAGAAAFVGPAIVSLFLGPLGAAGVVTVFAVLYVAAAVMTWFLKIPEETRAAMESGADLQEIAEETVAPQTPAR
ncbi:MFS transporter [Nocardiopsis composta]